VSTRYGASDLDVQYRVEERQGIPFARNAVLEAFQEFGDVLAFVDDDEEVTSSWLSRLLTTWSSTGADVVAGPVLPLFEEEPPSWVVRGGLFNRKRMATG